MRYVALLRGVNVGGNHRVPKSEFQAVLERLGFRDIVIYLNSGNAVFTSDEPVDSDQIQQAMEGYFDFDIPTLVLPGQDIQRIAAAIPGDWVNDSPKPDKSGMKTDVLYLFDEVNTPDVLQGLGYKPEIEAMIYVDGAVIANITRANQTRGSLQKVISTGLYGKMTIRNVNTARKLADLV